MVLTSADGRKVLDTDEALFHVVGAMVTGSISFPELRVIGGNPDVNTTETFTLGSCHPDCTDIIGAVLFNGSSGGAVGFDRYTTYMGGDLIWLFASPPKLANANAGEEPSDLISYRFECSGGVVRMIKRMIILAPPLNNTFFVRAHSLTYRLKAGLFT